MLKTDKNKSGKCSDIFGSLTYGALWWPLGSWSESLAQMSCTQFRGKYNHIILYITNNTLYYRHNKPTDNFSAIGTTSRQISLVLSAQQADR